MSGYGMTRVVICRVVICLGVLLTVVHIKLSSRLTRKSRKGSLPFSSTPLVDCMSVFCWPRRWCNAWNSLCFMAVIVSSIWRSQSSIICRQVERECSSMFYITISEDNGNW